MVRDAATGLARSMQSIKVGLGALSETLLTLFFHSEQSRYTAWTCK